MSPIDPRELQRPRTPRTEYVDAGRTCRSCGYSLKGLTTADKCPECGTAVQAARPVPSPAEVISSDRLCGKCRYNLRGLSYSGRCPECGHPIRGGGRTGFRRLSDNLTQAPLYYLKTLAIGAWLLAGSGLGLVIAVNLARERNRLDAAIAAGVLGVIWTVAVYIVTAPRAFSENTLRDELLDGPHLRWINRGASLAWVAFAVAWMIALRAPFGSTLESTAQFGADCFTIIAVVSLATLGLQLAALGDWAGDDQMADRFRLTSWIMGATVLASLGAALARMVPGLLTGLLSWFAGALSIIGAMALIYFAWLLICLADVARWAVANHLTADETEQRVMTARARREKEMADRTAVAIALQDAAPPPSLTADARSQTRYETSRVDRPREGANPYGLEPDP